MKKGHRKGTTAAAAAAAPASTKKLTNAAFLNTIAALGRRIAAQSDRHRRQEDTRAEPTKKVSRETATGDGPADCGEDMDEAMYILWSDVCAGDNDRLDALLEEIGAAKEPRLVTRTFKHHTNKSVLDYASAAQSDRRRRQNDARDGPTKEVSRGGATGDGPTEKLSRGRATDKKPQPASLLLRAQADIRLAKNNTGSAQVIACLHARNRGDLVRVIANNQIVGEALYMLWCDVCAKDNDRLDALLEEIGAAKEPRLVTRTFKHHTNKSVLDYVKKGSRDPTDQRPPSVPPCQ